MTTLKKSMTTRKKISLGLISFAALLICSGAVFFAIRFAGGDPPDSIAVYFFNPTQGQLQAEARTMAHGGYHEQIAAALQSFARGPADQNLSAVWPVDTDVTALIEDLHIYENILYAQFSEMYADLPPADEVIFRAAFTLTMTGLPHIYGVNFRFGDEEIFETAASITNNPFISPARRTAQDFLLFFADEAGEWLVTEIYRGEGVNVHARGQYILARLIEGQNAPGFLPLIPPETRVRDVFFEPDSGVYVDLSGEFHSRFAGTPAQAQLMLQSVTHTMLANAGGNIPRRVFFLIDSERKDDFHGVGDFHMGFAPDETVLFGWEE